MKKTFAILWALCMLGTLAVLPIVQVIAKTPLDPKFYVYSFLQATVLYGVAVYVGLKLAANIQLKISEKLTTSRLLQYLYIAVLLALAIHGLHHYVFPLDKSIQLPNPPLWQKLIASLYGAVNEEVLMRLFLVSLLIKIFHALFKPAAKNHLFIYLSILLAALAFGMGHLPAMAQITTLTPMIVTRTLVLNGLAGIIFGWLYWRRSLQSAMAVHGTTDIILAFLP